MADAKISAISAATAAYRTDKIPIARSGANYTVTPAQIRNQYVSQNTPANLARFRRQLKRVMTDGSDNNLAINLYGDSISMGSGATYARNNIGARLAQLFQASGFVAREFKHGLHTSAAATATYDPRYAFSGTWGGYGDLPGGPSFRCTTSSGTVTYTPGYAWDVCDVLWYRNSVGGGGGGDMTITTSDTATFTAVTDPDGTPVIDDTGVTTVTKSQSGSAGLMSTRITCTTSANRSITVTNGASNNIQIYGFECRTAGQPTIIIRTQGYSGYWSTLYAGAAITNAMYQTPLKGHLTLLCMGSNDTRTATSLSTYATNIATIRASIDALSSASVVYWTWPPEVISGGTTDATQQSYIDAFITAAGSNTAVVDIWRKWRDLGGQSVLASNQAGYYSDTIHPNAVGNWDIAEDLFKAIWVN